ncbi:MAG: hypothetical protein WBA67_13835, partial [Jannaschia sp.]
EPLDTARREAAPCPDNLQISEGAIMFEPTRCLRLFNDEAGDSHFEEIQYGMSSIQYAPPAPPLVLSDPIAADRLSWFRFPEGWHDAAHPSPRRQVFILLEGVVEVWTSCGEVRRLAVGDRLLMEDTFGTGHGARPVDGPAFGVMIALA